MVTPKIIFFFSNYIKEPKLITSGMVIIPVETHNEAAVPSQQLNQSSVDMMDRHVKLPDFVDDFVVS